MLDSDSDGYIGLSNIDPNKCFSCGGPYKAEEAHLWIGCNRCPRWLHRKCVKDVNFHSMTEEEIEEYYFECVYCKLLLNTLFLTSPHLLAVSFLPFFSFSFWLLVLPLFLLHKLNSSECSWHFYSVIYVYQKSYYCYDA